MKKNTFRWMVFPGFVCLFLSFNALAQDFQQSYRVGSGASVNIRNISGNVVVTGYNGDAIIVTGYKEGRDRDQITVEDRSTGASVDVRAKYPENCRCNASIRFDVKVPSEMVFKYNAISSVSGDVEVSNVRGELKASSVSGEVTVKSVEGAVQATSVSGNVSVGEVDGTVSAKSTSGNVEVEIRSLEGASNLDFASVSGNVRVKLPGSLDADVKMSTLSGDLRTDFPIQIEEKKYGPGRSASGRIGGGSRTLKMSTVSGNVSLLRM